MYIADESLLGSLPPIHPLFIIQPHWGTFKSRLNPFRTLTWPSGNPSPSHIEPAWDPIDREEAGKLEFGRTDTHADLFE
jgi:hypothetical protein